MRRSLNLILVHAIVPSQMFTFLACLLDVSTPIKHRFKGHIDPHYGRFDGLRLETEAGAILSFAWISHTYSLPQPDTALGRSLEHAALVLLGGHASYPLELWPQSLAQLHAAVRNCTANATVALIEPFPAHFPSFREHRNGTAPEIPPGSSTRRFTEIRQRVGLSALPTAMAPRRATTNL